VAKLLRAEIERLKGICRQQEEKLGCYDEFASWIFKKRGRLKLPQKFSCLISQVVYRRIEDELKTKLDKALFGNGHHSRKSCFGLKDIEAQVDWTKK